MGLKSTHKAAAWFVAAFLLAGLVVTLSFWSFRQIEDASKARKNTFAAIVSADALLSDLTDAETGQRGYVLTGNADFLEPYLAVRDSVGDHLTVLRSLKLGSAANRRLDLLDPLVNVKMAELAQVIELRRKQDVAAATALVGSGRGKQLMDSIRAGIRAFTGIEEQVLARNEAQFESNMQRMYAVIVGAGLAALLSALAFAYLIRRQIQQRLRNLVHLETQDLLEIQKETNEQLQQANATLQVSESALREAQHLAGLGNWSWDVRTGRHAWSEEIYRIYGREPSLGPAAYPDVQSCYRVDDWDRIAAHVDTCLTQGTPYEFETEIARPDGTRCWVNVRGAAMCDGAGKVAALHGTMQDITQHKLVSDELEQHREGLERLVLSRTAELAEARDAAEAANRAKSDFLASMSHEIRTPLNAVVGLTGLIADSPLDRRQRDCADKLQLSAQALRAVVDDILDFSRIEAGALKLEQVPFSLNAILRTVAAVVCAGMGGKAIEVLFDVERDVPDALIGDPMRLQQIFLNLTGNALKFTDSGEIVLAVHCLARDSAQATLEFSVRDTGIGIPPEQLERIFDVFAQADTSTTRQYGGSGLGLAISARLAGLMGGRISLDSTVGLGSAFRFNLILPLAHAAPQSAQGTIPDGLSILIIDDHALARAVLQRSCTALGWHASAFGSGAAGLDELRRSCLEGRDYDVMLLDWRMPGMDGLEMLRHAYADPDIGLPQVILMASIVDLGQAAAASDDLYLDGIAAKPLTPSSLLDAVTRARSGDFSAIFPAPGKTDRRLGGMRLLVVDDNAINQEVIEHILTRAGAEVAMTGSAIAAFDALRAPAAQFDAVLMDIQMPGMDGHSAAMIIREEMGLVDLPIIAVTAHAGTEDRVKSRRAGMVGHIVKPIDIEDLLDILVARRRSTPAPPATACAMHLPGVDFGAAMSAFGGDAATYLDLLRRFVADHGGDADHARRLFGSADLQGAATLLHGFCGVASLLQATDVARLTAAIAKALRDGPAETVPPLFDELQLAIDLLGHALDRAPVQFAL